MITLDEAIKHCEEVAHQNEILMKRYDDAIEGYKTALEVWDEENY